MKLSDEYKRVAVYHNEIHYLSKYLGERNLNLANYIPWFLRWGDASEILERVGISEEELEKAQDEGSDEFYEMCDRITTAMSDQEKDSFVGRIALDDPTEAPAWAHMSLEKKRIPQQTWLVHFSNQSSDIIDEGFTRGVSEMDQVALTTYFTENAKKYGGYNFAFIAGNRDSRNAASSGKYGNGAVMFQSSGLEVYHYGDQENQVIYWGKTIDPKTIVELAKEDRDSWMVVPRFKSSMSNRGRDFVYKGTFSDVVSWVENHWFQYRRQIMGK